MSNQKYILSGIQPTGDMHFGNYFGAVKNWVKLQDDYRCLYSVVDYHAMTMPYQAKKLRQNTWDLIFNLMACGVKAENLFIQSMVPEHAELSWILTCFTSYGMLSRMTQFKDKSAHNGDSEREKFISAGLLNYPILQAADILIYRADFVPVGKDQEQHLELTRNIAERFNAQVGKDYFALPKTLFTSVPKVMSTADPTKKMSKSAGEKHYIGLFSDESRIRKQIKSAVTDAGEEPSNEMGAGVANLFSLLKASEHNDIHDELMQAHKNGTLKYVDLKHAVAEALVQISNTVKEKKSEILEHKKDYKNQIKASSATIRARAQETVKEVKDLVGLMNA